MVKWDKQVDHHCDEPRVSRRASERLCGQTDAMVAGPASWGTRDGVTLLTAFSAAVPPERACVTREENR